jgi:hypothetical protein
MRNWLLVLSLCLTLLLVSCSGDTRKDGEYLVRVNEYRITQAEVDTLLKLEAELDSNVSISEDTRSEFINELILTQLLIQEAKKRRLDGRERFRQTIQRYWESTLIRDLLTEKGEQLRTSTIVSQEEIEQYYHDNQHVLGGSLEEMAPELAKLLEERKVTAAIQEWIQELYTTAKIEIRDLELAAKVKEKKN